MTFNSYWDLQHTCFARWSDTAYSDHGEAGKCRLGFMVRLTPSAPGGSFRLIHWSSHFNRRAVKRGQAGGISAFGGMVDQLRLALGLYVRFCFRAPPLVVTEGRGNLFSHRYNKKAVTEKYLARNSGAIQDTINRNFLRNIFWPANPVV